MRSLIWIPVVVSFVLFFWADAARASGLESGTNGSQSMARPGAFVAKADDATAIEHNPAGLAFLRGFHFSLDSNFLHNSTAFQRDGAYPACPPAAPGSPNCVDAPYANQRFGNVEDQYGLSWVPQIAAAYGFGRVAVAAGLFGPSSVRGVDFGENGPLTGGNGVPGPQRYDLIGSDLFVAFPTLAIAARPVDWLSIGVSLHYAYSHLKFHQIASTPRYACPSIPNAGGAAGDRGGGDESPVCDVDVKVDATDSAGFSATAGFKITPSPNIELGATVRTQTDIDAEGKLQVIAWLDGPTSVLRADEPMSPDAKCPGGDAEVMRLQALGQKCAQGTSHIKTLLPWKVRTGGRYVFRSGEQETGDVELDLVYDRWSAFKAIDVQLGKVQPRIAAETNPYINVRVPHHYEDTYGFRLGGSKRFEMGTRGVEVRGGVSYETAATPVAYTRMDFASWDKIGVGAGVGVDLVRTDTFRATLHLGFGLVYLPERKVTDSNVAQTNALDIDPKVQANPDPPIKNPDRNKQPLTIVGNGTYTAAFHVFNAGLGIAY